MITMPVFLFLSLTSNERNLLEQLFEAYEKQVYGVSYSILQHEDDAEDNTIGVFTKLSSVLHRIEPDIGCKRNKAFIYVITKYAALDLCRKHQTDMQKARLEVTHSYISELSFEHLYYRELVQDMESISPQATAMLNLKYVYHFTSKEIARMYGLSVSNVDVQIHRAKQMMRKNKKIQGYRGGDRSENP